MDSLPNSLKMVYQDLEEQFTVPAEKLKAITSHFESELAKGTFFRSGKSRQHFTDGLVYRTECDRRQHCKSMGRPSAPQPCDGVVTSLTATNESL